MKKVNQKSKECAAVYTDCVEWAGPNIPAIGIKTGDCLTDTILKITEKLVAASAPLDLEDISLQCIIDTIGNEEPEIRSLNSILQLLVDNDCTLKQLIDQINQSNATPPLQLDLKCIAQLDSFGNVLPYTTQTVLQSLINNVCGFNTGLSDVNTRIDTLQTEVDALDTTPYVEPAISSCLFTNKPTSQALKILSDAFCSYQQVVGDLAQIQAALALQPPTANIEFAGVPGWVQTPTTLAQLVNNNTIRINALEDEVTNMRNNCCKMDCDDIDLGFGITIEDDNMTFNFNNLQGTNIPSAFTDCGSSFIIEDANGAKVGGYITITNNYLSDDISLISLEKGSMLTVSITSKFCSEDGQTCQKCLTKSVKYEGGCCVITNTGSEDLVIVYNTPLLNL